MLRSLLITALVACSASPAFAQTYQQTQAAQLLPGTVIPPLQPIILDATALRQVCLMPSPNGQGSVVVSPGFKACQHGVAVVCEARDGWVPTNFPHPCPQ